MQNADFIKKILFGYLTCKRLIPNYEYFSRNYAFGNSELLKHFLLLIRSKIIEPGLDPDFGDFESAIDKIAPTPDEYDSILASSALDACTSVFDLICFVKGKDDSHIDAISTAAIDSVDMYILQKEMWDMNDPKLNEKIDLDPLMQRERKRQNDIWNYLNKANAPIPFAELSTD